MRVGTQTAHRMRPSDPQLLSVAFHTTAVNYPDSGKRITMKPSRTDRDTRISMTRKLIAATVFVLAIPLLQACAPRIYGSVDLVDANQKPVAADNRQGTVVNMINTSAAVEQASHAVTTNADGKFESVKSSVRPGTYKVEANRIGYETQTQTVEIGSYTQKKIEFRLKKIQEGKRKSIKGTRSDEDKIINPGEVNIQPPTM
jgi:hypothetical protein